MIVKTVGKKEAKVRRLLEILIGLATWTLFLSPVWLGLLAPKVMILYITFLTVWWCYLAIRHTVGTIISYRKYQRELKKDWAQECEKLDFSALPDKKTLPPSLQGTKHFVLIPVVNEPDGVLLGCIGSLVSQAYPLNRVMLVFTAEEKFAEDTISRIKNLLADNIEKFEEVLFETHPAGIPGEAVGVAGANRDWGARKAIGHLEKTGQNLRNYIFTTFDSDSQLHHQFLARLTHLYLTTDRRDNHFYSTAIHLFNNNIWEVPMMMRIEANAVTLGSMSDWGVTHRDLKETFSCYSVSLQTLIDADFWDVKLGVDDTIFYWRAFTVRNGDFNGIEHYIPYSADAVQAETYWRSHVSMYRQLRRWGWGAISVPLSLTEFLKNKKIPAAKKLLWTIKHVETRIMFLSLVFLMTFGITIVTLVNRDSQQINLIYSLPNVLSTLLTGTMLLILPLTILRLKIVKPWPQNWNILRKFFSLLEGPLVILNLFTYSLIPWVDAQTRMMLGMRMKNLYHTPKIRN